MKIRSWRGYPEICIPKQILKIAGLKIGDYVWVEAKHEGILISKVGGESERENRAHTNRKNS